MEKPTEYSLTWEVTDEMTAKRIGSAGSKILSTPNMVALMEAAALELAKAYLDEGMTTVGAEIHCRHLAPTPVGMKVTATARLRSIERRKMWFVVRHRGARREGQVRRGLPPAHHGGPQGHPGKGRGKTRVTRIENKHPPPAHCGRGVPFSAASGAEFPLLLLIHAKIFRKHREVE